jgi:hypothetical protein
MGKLMALPACLLCVAGTSSAADDKPTPNFEDKKWLPQTEVETKLGSNGRHLLIPKSMIPLSQSENSLLYTDLRFKADNQDSEEANIGLGFRKINNNKYIIGSYLFYDRMNSEANNTYNQATLGFEVIDENWDAHTNIYMPEKQINSSGHAGTLAISGNSIQMQGAFERALPGYDGEVGYKLPVKKADVRGYIGGYHFDAEEFEKVAGQKARIEATVNESNFAMLKGGKELTLGAEYSNDDVRNENTSALLQYRVPIGKNAAEKKAALSPLEKRMMLFPERDDDIVAIAGGSEDILINGISINQIFTFDNSDDLSAGISGAGTNALFILDGTAGTFSETDSILMNVDQVIVGGGTTLTITGAQSGTSLINTFSGIAPTLDFTGSVSDAIVTNDNAYLANLSLVDTQDGIDILGDINVTVSNVSVTGSAGGIGIGVGNSDNVTISDVTISSYLRGFSIANGAQDVSIDGATISSVSDGVFMNGTVDDITLNDLTITSALDDGFDISGSGIGDLTISNSTVNGASSNAFEFTSATVAGLSGTGNTISGIIGGSNCETTGATITGSLTYNGATTCP